MEIEADCVIIRGRNVTRDLRKPSPKFLKNQRIICENQTVHFSFGER